MPPHIAKYICEDWTKEITEKYREVQPIKSKRLKITVHMIRDVLIEKCDWMFAAEKGLYRPCRD